MQSYQCYVHLMKLARFDDLFCEFLRVISESDRKIIASTLKSAAHIGQNRKINEL